jgi:riboflavin synthase
MFTGIVQAIGTVSAITNLNDDSKKIIIISAGLGSDFSIGESINVNGVCLTVESNQDAILSFTAVKETLNRSNLRELQIDSQVNLERAATLTTLMGGHLVTGHIDKTSKVISIHKSDNWSILEISIDQGDKKYLIHKGSITINGVSLTISDIKSNTFEVNLIPQTLSETNLSNLRINDEVNVEFDLIGKYVLNKASGGI